MTSAKAKLSKSETALKTTRAELHEAEMANHQVVYFSCNGLCLLPCLLHQHVCIKTGLPVDVFLLVLRGGTGRGVGVGGGR